jgi:dihydroorotate dehydrogenase electron transfer subunit
VEVHAKSRLKTVREGPCFSVPKAVLTHRQRGKGYARVTLAGIENARIAQPGQFIMIRRLGSKALPRAFSVLGAKDDSIELFVKLDGLLRELLGSAPFGTRLELRGPYGVPYEQRIDPRRSYVLVGGGSGAAPLLFFHQAHPELVDALVLGFRHSGADTLFPDLDLVVEAVSGKRAHDRLAELWRPGLGIIACGPEPMLRAIVKQHPNEPDVYVSLEARLGCGIGSCLGCSIPTTDGTRRICRDGPLFACSELPWLH